MKIKERKVQKLKRKNFFPLLIITLLLWLIWGGLVYFVSPDIFGAIPAFFLITFAALFLTFSILLENSRRGMVLTVSVVFFMFLRFLGVGNIVNLLLLMGLVITFEFFYSKK